MSESNCWTSSIKGEVTQRKTKRTPSVYRLKEENCENQYLKFPRVTLILHMNTHLS